MINGKLYDYTDNYRKGEAHQGANQNILRLFSAVIPVTLTKPKDRLGRYQKPNSLVLIQKDKNQYQYTLKNSDQPPGVRQSFII